MSKSELLCKVDKLTEQYGEKFVLENLCRGLSSDTLEETLRFLFRQLGIPFETEDNE